jgi:hypothetical protein
LFSPLGVAQETGCMADVVALMFIEAALKGGDCGTVVSVMRQNPDDALVQERACFSIAELTLDALDSVKAVLEEALVAVFAALQAHRTVARLQLQGLLTLAYLARVAPLGVLARAGAAGVLQLVVARLSAQDDAVGVQHACILILCCFVMDEELREPAEAAGTVQAVLASMQRFPNDVNIQAQGCATLCGLCSTPTGRSFAGISGAMNAVVAAMVELSAHKEVQEKTTLLLCCLVSKGPDVRTQPCAAGAVQALAAIVRVHGGSAPDVLQHASSALAQLAADECTCHAAVAGGGVDALVKIISAHSVINEGVMTAIMALSVLVDKCGACGAACACGAFEETIALMQALSRRPAGATLRLQTAGKLGPERHV